MKYIATHMRFFVGPTQPVIFEKSFFEVTYLLG